MAERDREGVFRGSCINHPPHRFGGCERFILGDGTSKCRTCSCVARSHVAFGPCTRHSCGGYDELPSVSGECCNCGCPPSEHRGDYLLFKCSQNIAKDGRRWKHIQQLAKAKRNEQLDANPPKRQCRKPGGGRGGPRPNSGRKKSIPKEITATPVKLVSRRLGKYQANGPKEFVSLSGVDTGTSEGLTLKTLENVMLGHFLGLTREQAVDRYQFYILKTLRGPQLTMDSHITGKQFYFYWRAGVEMVKRRLACYIFILFKCFSREIDREKCELSVGHLFQDSSDEEEAMRDSLDPLPELESEPLTSLSASNTAATNAPLRSVRSPAPSVVLSKKATDQRRRGQLRGLALAVPSSLPVRPSAVINLGKSIALPPVRQTELPVAITSFTMASDWGSIETEGPLHCVLDVQGFPAQPFGSGTFQNAFKATCIVPNKFLDFSGRYVLKQQKLEGPLTTEAVDGLSSEDMDLMDEESSRKSAKACQISAVANALCQHYNLKCRQIPDYGEEIRVLPSLFVKMTGQFPSCGILEHEIEGTWQKFLNNDGLEMGGEENQFKLKALAFAHWTFNKFDGRLLVCDLQGADYTLSDLEIASTDERLV
ncbi:unnamed protein product [Porites evermanni]|uniref:Alpha-type protein kinase domain-containing protein n=1 Tax=Porites evermanni TaxID=104178 RepID=A0ABN8SE57_9CNID|nr:unnamed protein product [Porites evermanni]